MADYIEVPLYVIRAYDQAPAERRIAEERRGEYREIELCDVRYGMRDVETTAKNIRKVD